LAIKISIVINKTAKQKAQKMMIKKSDFVLKSRNSMTYNAYFI